MTAFEASLASGPHALLRSFAGSWRGTTRTWFEPGELGDESQWTGTVRSVLGGRFVVHEYSGTLTGKPLDGHATLGYDLAQDRFVCAWIDSGHMTTAVLLSLGEPAAREEVSVLGSYEAPEGPPWGWRTSFASPAPDELVIAHHNVPPAGSEYLAVETRYRRSG